MTKDVKKELYTRLRDIQGKDFVFRCIKLFLTDPTYFEKVRLFVKPEYFAVESTATDGIVKVMLDAPNNFTEETIKDLYKEDAGGDETKLKEYGFTFDKVKSSELGDYDTLKAIVEPFLHKMKIVEITATYSDMVTWERYQKNPMKLMRRMADECIKSLNVNNDDTGSSAEDDIKAALKENVLERIPTGEEYVDQLTNGGIPRKSVAGFIAPPGYGKSTIAAMLGYEAAVRGYKVLHIFFEDDKSLIWRKYYSRMLNVKADDIKGDEMENTIRNNENFQRIKDNVILVKWDTGQKYVEDIDQLITSKILEGFTPDMLIIDYFDCLQMSTNPIRDKYEAQERSMRKIENLATKRNLLVWAMLQANRMATSKNNTDGTAQNIEGSKKIKNITSTVMALGKDTENPGYYMFELDKSRFVGKECVVHRVKFNPGTIRFDWSEADAEFRNIYENGNNDSDEWEKSLTITPDYFESVGVENNGMFYLTKDKNE